MNDLDSLLAQAASEFDAAPTAAELENAKARFLGKSGRVTELLKGLGALSPEEKKSRGGDINRLKTGIEHALQARREALAEAELQAQLKAQALDVTLPGRQRGQGSLHPVSRTIERIEAIFGSMGFDVAEGPEIETDWMSFTALNNPENHPARSMQDTPAPCRCAMPACTLRPMPARTRYPRSASSPRAALTAWTAMPRIRPCSTSARGCGSASTSVSRT